MRRKDHIEIKDNEWNEQYSDGVWDYLCQADEGARYSVILGYIRRYVPEGKVLDLGCGAGILWDYLTEQEKANYTGIDFSDEAIKLAKRKSEKSFVVSNICEYKPNEKYDAIVFNEVLYYLPQPLSVVKRYFDYLKPGGIIVVSMFLYPDIFDNEYKIVVNSIKELEEEDSFLVMDKTALINEVKWKRKWYLITLREKNVAPISFDIKQVFFDKFRNYKVFPDEYKGMKGEEFFLRTKCEYYIYCIYIPVENAKGTIIISHGYVNYIPYLKYLPLFYKRGFNILIYDMRGLGKSDGDGITYGYYEKQDLSSCIDWVIKRCGKECTIGLFGDGIGAAVSIQNLQIDSRASFCIADSSFTDLPIWLKRNMKKEKHILPIWLKYACKNAINIIKTGSSYGKNSPVKAVSDIEKPILFIHGRNDDVIPCEMSVNLYNNKSGMKKIKIFENANHVTSYINNKEEYDKVVGEFLREIEIE